jgi:hypothetical protein
MRVERTMMASDVAVELTSHRGPATGTATATKPVPGTAPIPASPTGYSAAAASVEAVEQRPGPVMPGLSAGDRAAIATATGFYIAASGKVTPEGMPPWGFIVRYIEQRQSERQADPAAGVDPIEGAAPVFESEHVDVTV